MSGYTDGHGGMMTTKATKGALGSNDQLRAVSEARRYPACKGTNWKPIETAPKDGARVDLINAHSGLFDSGCWCDYKGQSMTGIPGEWNQELGNGDMTHWRKVVRDE